MKTEQEQRQAIRQILFDANDICQATPCENEYCIYHGDYRCYDNIIVDKLIKAGYGDISEYKAENERLTKILNSLTFSKKETDIFGKPALLMFAGVKVEEAIKRVTEYNGLKAEIERLKDEIIYLERKIAIRDNALKDSDKAIEMLEGKQDAIVKQAQIDILNKAKERLDSAPNGWAYTTYIDELIEEVENDK